MRTKYSLLSTYANARGTKALEGSSHLEANWAVQLQPMTFGHCPPLKFAALDMLVSFYWVYFITTPLLRKFDSISTDKANPSTLA